MIPLVWELQALLIVIDIVPTVGDEVMAATIRQERVADWAPTLVRRSVGSAMVVNGTGKLLNIGPRALGIEAFAAYLRSLGIPFPTLFA